MKTLSRLAVAMFGLVIMPLFAGSLMPDLSLAPTGWQVDRYAPASFTNLGSMNGRNNVLGLGIDSSTDYANRPGFQYTFYNTQGEGTPINGGPGDDIAVLLYVPDAWGDSNNGDVRTDLWVNATGENWGILGFTNFGTNNRAGIAGGTFQYWDSVAGIWTATDATVNYNAWNTLRILYTGSGFSYSINGQFVGSGGVDAAATGAALTRVNLEAYNYNDPTFGASYGQPDLHSNLSVDYTAEYANVPEPASFGLIGLGLLGLSVLTRRKFRA